MRPLDEITGAVVDASVKIHKELGPGLLESVYEVILARELERRGFDVERQRLINFEYDGMFFEEGFRIDLLVDRRVVVELKSVEMLAPVHSKQLLTYLRLMDMHVGLLINFGEATLKDGLRRIVNGLPSSASPYLRVNRAIEGTEKYVSRGGAGDTEGTQRERSEGRSEGEEESSLDGHFKDEKNVENTEENLWEG